MGLRDGVELAHKKDVFWGLHIGIREILQDLQDSRTGLRLMLFRFLFQVFFRLTLHHNLEVHIVIQVVRVLIGVFFCAWCEK